MHGENITSLETGREEVKLEQSWATAETECMEVYNKTGPERFQRVVCN